MVAFGVRNFTDPVRGLSEMRRVLRRNGMVVVLEFSQPDGSIFKHLYNIYFGVMCFPLSDRCFQDTGRHINILMSQL